MGNTTEENNDQLTDYKNCKGCIFCEYKYRCPDAFTEQAQYCGEFDHDEFEYYI